MFDCSNCKNRENYCKHQNNRFETAKELEKDVKDLWIKYKHHFYGSIEARCDYFIPEKVEMATCNRG